MTRKLKVLVVDDGNESSQVRNMFAKHGDFECVVDIYDADMVCFVGGSDVSPSLYNQSQHRSTHTNPPRDEFEQTVYGLCLDMGLPMIGICRGGQFLNVMNGGSMYQDVDNHNGRMHRAYFPENLDVPYLINSYHHQMMAPNQDVNNKVLLVSNQSKKKLHMSTLVKDVNIGGPPYEILTYPPAERPTDVEAVWYPDTRCLCYQPHPEYLGAANKETYDLFFNFIDDYILGDELFLGDREATSA